MLSSREQRRPFKRLRLSMDSGSRRALSKKRIDDRAVAEAPAVLKIFAVKRVAASFFYGRGENQHVVERNLWARASVTATAWVSVVSAQLLDSERE